MITRQSTKSKQRGRFQSNQQQVQEVELKKFNSIGISVGGTQQQSADKKLRVATMRC